MWSTKPCAVCSQDFTTPEFRKAKYCSQSCFSKRPQHKDSREENKEKRRVYRLANREKIRAYEARPDVLEKKRRWVEENKERVRAGQRRYTRENPRKVSEAGKRYRDTPEYKESNRIWYKAYRAIPKNRIKTLFNSAKQRAAKSGLDFTISMDGILKHGDPTHCLCCGKKFDYSVRDGMRSYDSPSLDRKDNSRGYTPDNTFVICFGCNSLKSDAKVKDIENLLTYMRGGLVELEGAA